MKKATLLLLAALACNEVVAADIEVRQPVTVQLPTENMDGSELIDLAKITVHFGLASREYNVGILELTQVSPNPFVGEKVDVELAAVVPVNSQLYVSGTATDVDGDTSDYGNEVVYGPYQASQITKPLPPGIAKKQGAVITKCPPGWRCTLVE